MKTINLDILVSDYSGGYRLSKDLYIHPGKGGDVDEEMIRLDTFGLCIVEEGEYSIRLNNKTYTLSGGEILIANTNDFYENVRFSDDFEGMVIFASIDLLDKLVEPTHLHHCLKILKHQPVHRIEDGLWNLVKSYCASLTLKTQLHNIPKANETTEMISKVLLADIFNLVLKDIEALPIGGNESRPQILFRQFINLIISTPAKPHEVAYYADKLSISPRYLANLCKAVSNKSAKEWINEYIMNDVRRYLIGTDLSIKEVASRTLFTNFSFFSKTVKRHFCKTPLELRNKK